MQLYHPNKTSLTLNGVTYSADEHGIIDVPDSQMNSSVWTQGFVNAKGRLAQLAAQAVVDADTVGAAHPTVIDPSPNPEPAKASSVKTKSETKPTQGA